MTYRMMLKTMWLKLRYGIKSYLLYLIVTVLFIIVFFFQLYVMDIDEFSTGQSTLLAAFLYIPVLINQSVQTVEYSKCYYLVPRTQNDRKRFFIFQNIVKMILSLLLSTILLLAGTVVRPEAFQYLLNWYLLAGVSFSIVLGCNGYSTYYMKKKKRSYTAYIVSYVVTVIVMLVILFGGMFCLTQKSSKLCTLGSVGIIVISTIYSLYYFIRFKKVDAVYDNINKEERRFTTRMINSVM